MLGGWQRDLPDNRDLSFATNRIRRRLLRLDFSPRPCDSLRDNFPAFEPEAAGVNSVAIACAALFQYFLFRVYERREHRSALFLDRIATRLAGGESGSDLSVRTVLRALVRFGIPPVKYLSGSPDRIDLDPLLFGFAQDVRSVRYFRLDPPNQNGLRTCRVVRAFVAAGFPAVFGFVTPESLPMENLVGGWSDIRLAGATNPPVRGHAAVVVGFDDERSISSGDAGIVEPSAIGAAPSLPGRGAFLIRYSLPATAHDSFLWLPYAFVEQQQAVDFWTMLSDDWLRRSFAQPDTPLSRPSLRGLF